MQSAFYFLLSKFWKKDNQFEYGLQILVGDEYRRLTADPVKQSVEQGGSLGLRWDYFENDASENMAYQDNLNCLWRLNRT